VKRIGITLSLLALLIAALALPGSASSANRSRADIKSASKACKTLRAQMGTKAFKRAFGDAKKVRKAHRRCVARGAVLPKVTLQSETQPSACPPGTVPEPPQPVRAFGTSSSGPVCVPAPPSAAPAQPAADDEAAEDADDQADDNDADDDHADDDHADDDHPADRAAASDRADD
jgi:hypothetical protein